MNILFISSVSLISNVGTQTKDLLIKACGLPLEPSEPDPDYVFSEKIPGSKHFGVWPLSQAAEACFGRQTWPQEHALPQVSIELEVESRDAVAAAEVELRAQGYHLLHGTRTEPWGQTVCRVLSAEGAILGISFAPWLHPRS
jgi:hypothetical protein